MTFEQKVEAPPFQIALRPESISEFERLLYLRPRYDKEAIDEYTVRFDSDDKVLLTASGIRYDRKGVRDLRDGSGLPLFECERIWTPIWRKRGPWLIRLPGGHGISKGRDEASDIASTCRSSVLLEHDFDMTFRNVAAQDVKSNAEKMITLHIRRKNPDFCVWTASLGNRVVVHIRESFERNRHQPSTGRLTSSTSRRAPCRRLALDVLVASGFDLSLAALISVMVSDMSFSMQSTRGSNLNASGLY